jgi:hypothetical protein
MNACFYYQYYIFIRYHMDTLNSNCLFYEKKMEYKKGLNLYDTIEEIFCLKFDT